MTITDTAPINHTTILDRPPTGPTGPIGRPQAGPVGRPQLGPVDRLADLLSRYSIDLLRVCVGLVLLGFGVLKFFPGLSPVEALVTRTVDTITFGAVTGQTAMVATAAIECCVGLMLICKVLLRTGLVLLLGCIVGFMCPLVLFFSDMFPGGHPTLEAQYMLKDIVLAAAGLVVLGKALMSKSRR